MEFKGTKVLQVDLKHNQVLNNSGVLVIANINDYNGEGKYDTLLYSKAPEMLQALITTLEELEDIDVLENHRNYILQLIKQATEL